MDALVLVTEIPWLARPVIVRAVDIVDLSTMVVFHFFALPDRL